MAAARIGRIRLKSGGAEVRLIRQELPDSDGAENYRGLIIDHARKIAARSGADLRGFLVVGFFTDGGYSVSLRLDDGVGFSRTMLPSYVAEIVRRDYVTALEAQAVVDRNFGWPPDAG